MKKILLAAALFLPALPLLAAPSGCLFDLGGTVEIHKAGAPGWTPARKGDALDQGDRVRTGEKAWCELLLRDGSYVKLDAGSETAADELKASAGERLLSFSFLRGKALWMAARLKAKAASKFSVRTPSAVCAVRGTDFTITVSTAGETTVGLFEGTVAVGSGSQETELRGGQEAYAGPGGLTVEGRLSKFMKAEERRCARLRSRVAGLRRRLAERETFLDEYMARQAKRLSDFDARRAEKLGRK
ncbi:MAG: hypothetical protein CVU79_11495 [Elusimicrobia bacterium HGW-Elusimicrobia-3]|jgi:hypothetical protein|nr:MAG: hypothetical protein CVU79_11495 [Elusimicrobia bacterium HGW-Elusimicrobia-3]